MNAWEGIIFLMNYKNVLLSKVSDWWQGLGEIDMGKFFDYDGPLMSFVNRFASLMWLGILTLVCCIPVITAGASLTAMYYTVFKMHDRDRGYVTENFFHAFKTNFLKSTVYWLMMIVMYCILYADFVILTRSTYEFPVILLAVTILIAVIVILTASYVFPLQARFENTVKQTVKNAFLMSLFHLPKSILIIFLHVVPYVVLYIYPVSFPAVLVLGLSAPAYFNAVLLLSVFGKYSQEETAVPQEEACEESEEAVMTDTADLEI